ncbi:hypothetical protein BDZ97DRAFT_450397 [Flammula alnicola]|nr:hypothetical protein BDZ97DRAFT_450397 [Flammula alnicola]
MRGSYSSCSGHRVASAAHDVHSMPMSWPSSSSSIVMYLLRPPHSLVCLLLDSNPLVLAIYPFFMIDLDDIHPFNRPVMSFTHRLVDLSWFLMSDSFSSFLFGSMLSLDYYVVFYKYAILSLFYFSVLFMFSCPLVPTLSLSSSLLKYLCCLSLSRALIFNDNHVQFISSTCRRTHHSLPPSIHPPSSIHYKYQSLMTVANPHLIWNFIISFLSFLYLYISQLRSLYCRFRRWRYRFGELLT